MMIRRWRRLWRCCPRDGNCSASSEAIIVFHCISDSQFYPVSSAPAISATRPITRESSRANSSENRESKKRCNFPLRLLPFVRSPASHRMTPTPSGPHPGIPIAFPINSSTNPSQNSIFSFSASAPRNYQAKRGRPLQLFSETTCCCCGTTLKYSRNVEAVKCSVAGCEVVLDLVEGREGELSDGVARIMLRGCCREWRGFCGRRRFGFDYTSWIQGRYELESTVTEWWRRHGAIDGTHPRLPTENDEQRRFASTFNIDPSQSARLHPARYGY